MWFAVPPQQDSKRLVCGTVRDIFAKAEQGSEVWVGMKRACQKTSEMAGWYRIALNSSSKSSSVSSAMSTKSPLRHSRRSWLAPQEGSPSAGINCYGLGKASSSHKISQAGKASFHLGITGE